MSLTLKSLAPGKGVSIIDSSTSLTVAIKTNDSVSLDTNQYISWSGVVATGTGNNQSVLKVSTTGITAGHTGIRGEGVYGVVGTQTTSLSNTPTFVAGIYGELSPDKSTTSLSCGVYGRSRQAFNTSNGTTYPGVYGEGLNAGVVGISGSSAGEGANGTIGVFGYSFYSPSGDYATGSGGTTARGIGVAGSASVDVGCVGNGLLYLKKRNLGTSLVPTDGAFLYVEGTDLKLKIGDTVYTITKI
jgi:hypothetical protein